MTDVGVSVTRRRTGWDIAGGILLIVLALVILGDVVVATKVSVLFVGWFTLIAGLAALLVAIFKIGTKAFWSAAIGGGLLTALGLMIIRHPGAAAVTITLLIGTAFLFSGVVRLIAASDAGQARTLMIISGIASVILGVIVLFDIITASYALIGWLLGLQVLFDGITMLIYGRLIVTVTSTQPVT